MAVPVTLPDPLPPRHPRALGLVRMAALECRAAARLDVARACAALDPAVDAAGIAGLLMRALPQAMRGRPHLHPPGAAATSFDEDWLLALLDAVARGDAASERFLLARRCVPHRAPMLGLLLRALQDRLAA